MTMDRKTHTSIHIQGRVEVIFMFCLLVCDLSFVEGSEVKIAAFNVQVFGKTKVSKPNIVDILVKIIRRYDIILIQEVRDKSETAIARLLEEVNKVGDQYEIEISERLGRTSSKEQYVFLYRKDTVSVKGTYQYPDSSDDFEREPFAVLFHVPRAVVTDFALVAIHTSPFDVVHELNHMVTVHSAITSYWNTQDVLIMGDFNADCGYLNNAEKKSLWLRADNFHWWIDDDVDTTVKSTSCAYDRFVMTGSKLIESVADGSAKVFHFDRQYGLNESFAAAVSDHYPIEISLASDDSGHLTSSAPGSNRGGIVGFIKHFYKRVQRYARLEL